MSSDLSLGAMTPDIPNESTIPEFGSLSRKHSKSSINREDQSMPSPPLSPYQSSDSNNTTTSSKSNHDLKKNVQLKESNKADFQNTSKIDTFVTLSNSEAKINDNYSFYNHSENFPLTVNAWSNVGSKNFKTSQINFLRQYLNRSKSAKSGSISKYSRRYAPRRIVRSYYAESTAQLNHSNSSYNSDSDYNSQFEKIRTRRIARTEGHSSSSSTTKDLGSSISRPSTPQPKKRKQITIASPVQSAPIDWESVPDFSPDVSTLPNNARCLRVEWKGQPMSLSDDALVSKLHPAEVTLASILRLPCDLYLDSKRRLFAEKVTRFKRGLPFRRTDAQKSCRIDVNKASRLFAAFEKIGWLDDKYFEKYL